MDIMINVDDMTVLQKATNMLEDCTKINGDKVCVLKISLYMDSRAHSEIWNYNVSVLVFGTLLVVYH